MPLAPAARFDLAADLVLAAIEFVALMVVADRKKRLALCAERRNEERLWIGQLEYLADAPVQLDGEAGLVLPQPGEMMRRLSLQQRKNGAWRRGSRPIVLVADGRVDVARPSACVWTYS